MRTLVHLSDLHFGALRAETLEPLANTLAAIRPDLIAVSGDLTQRARRWQFAAARAFLDRLPFSKIVVPGNHDVPLYNVYARFCRPLVLYRRYISDDLEPFYADNEMAVQGINTARSFTFTKGRINARQIRLARDLAARSSVIKIILTHHPFDLPESYPESALVGRARMAMTELARCGIDLFLAGHHHIGLAEPSTLRFKVSGHSALLIQAGTATSSRCRGEMNSFNVIRIAKPTIEVERFVWQHDGTARFMNWPAELFEHGENGWSNSSPVPT
jgi:3',5'-cyclic AMP phosphodiesterase CpdA